MKTVITIHMINHIAIIPLTLISGCCIGWSTNNP